MPDRRHTLSVLFREDSTLTPSRGKVFKSPWRVWISALQKKSEILRRALLKQTVRVAKISDLFCRVRAIFLRDVRAAR